MEEIDVPPFFLCPISLEIMKDPVTVPTGITYDRESIEKWLFSSKNNTCPVTKQLLSDTDVTPNITLRRLIQAWCTLNASNGIERIPTPKPPINKTQILKLINEAKSPQMKMKCLKKLQLFASESDTNKRCMEAAGAVEFLASIINNANSESSLSNNDEFHELSKASDEALSLLYQLKISESSFGNLVRKNTKLIDSLLCILRYGNCDSQTYAVLVLKSMLEVADPMQLISLSHDFFIDIVQVLKYQLSSQASKAALKLLMDICPWGRNIVKAVEAGAVTVLIELLLDCSEKRPCEMMLTVLDRLCGCAEGRAELLKHGAGVALVSKKILRVSHVGSERAVRILASISKYSATPSVVQEMLQLGVVTKLCLVLQVDCGNKTKEKAKEILKLHARAWMNSSCIPSNLLSSYPS